MYTICDQMTLAVELNMSLCAPVFSPEAQLGWTLLRTANYHPIKQRDVWPALRSMILDLQTQIRKLVASDPSYTKFTELTVTYEPEQKYAYAWCHIK